MTDFTDLKSSVLQKLPEGEEINPVTAADIRFFQRHQDIAFEIEANDRALSCEDAAMKRVNQGWEGIPAHKELKTLASIYQLENGKYQIALTHCPGDEKISTVDLKETLGTDRKIMPFQTEAVSFGRFSPFMFDQEFIEQELKTHKFEVKKKNDWKDFDLSQLDENNPVVHVFHSDLIGLPREIETPAGAVTHCIDPRAFDYMYTNFGHDELGVKFCPLALIGALYDEGSAKIASITSTPNEDVTEYMRLWSERDDDYACDKIGIITGSNTGSAELLIELIKEKYAEALGDKFHGERSLPQFVLFSNNTLDLELNDGNADVIKAALKSEAQKLMDDGCTIMALASDALDVFDDTLTNMRRGTRTIYIPVHGPVKEYLHSQEITDIAIIGTTSVSSLEKWSPYQNLPDYYTVYDTPQDLPLGTKSAVIFANGDLQGDFNAASSLAGMTENDIKVIDTLDIHADRIVEIAIGAGTYTRTYWNEVYGQDSCDRFDLMTGADEEPKYFVGLQ